MVRLEQLPSLLDRLLKIRQTVEILENAQPPAFVPLPVEIR